MTEEEVSNWVREAYQSAVAHIASLGVVTESVAETESRYLAPYIALWKLKSNNNEWFWVTSGEIPNDYIRAESAKDARAAMHSFSLRWQLKAENLRNAEEDNQKEAGDLERSAEMMYQAYEESALWQ